ncbi:MAG: DUF4838 domain-containing protein [Oscillospiraceae bacterium]|nr:DUF4838 domain-containing protein [Oscillospiraceae bacterium]
MLQIKKLRCDHVIDFAAEELKKYLRMMMPEGGDVAISTDPEAKDGFRLGLLEDFSLPFEGEDARLDDVVHIDTQECGGILAGSNPRSVLFAVYRFLKLHGCRWLYPGVDGEFIPVTELKPQSYHKMADMRFRGHCNEGAESQTCMLETIDLYAKQELSVYMLEFKNPFCYYNTYYSHARNQENRPPEPVSEQQVLQWKRQCETEIAKRGLMFHDMGHGWTADPFGMQTGDNSGWRNGTRKLTEEQRSVLALMNGKRDLYRCLPGWTNLCYSQPYVRSTMADAVVAYAENHSNVDYLHVWLADLDNNHCECEECQKMRPSDWYMMIMNEIDEKLTAKGMDTRIVFIAYVDTLFAPEKVTLNNPERFLMLYAPISRSYSSSIDGSTVIPPAKPYVRNKWTAPVGAEEAFAYVREWEKTWHGPCITYEYHFWRHQYHDLGGIEIARRIYEDIRGMKELGLQGFIEDGSQRSFFPNGFAIYTYAETLMNTSVSFEELKQDYFSHIYGEDWEQVAAYLESMGKAFDFAYLAGEKSKNRKISKRYNPDMVQSLSRVAEIAASERALAKTHMAMPTRPQTVSWRLLLRHAEYAERLAEVLMEKAVGHENLAREMGEKFIRDFGKYEFELERYFDHGLGMGSVEVMLRSSQDFVFFIS